MEVLDDTNIRLKKTDCSHKSREIDQAVKKVIDNANFVFGQEIREFEEEVVNTRRQIRGGGF